MILTLFAALLASSPVPLSPPVAKKEPHKLVLHGDTLVDDYFWMRRKGTPEVEAHLRAELAYAESFMKPTSALQQKLYDEMLSRIQQTDVNVPYRENGYFYYSRTEEGKQYPIYCRKKGSIEAAEEILLDVNRLAEGKAFMSIGILEVSPDGNLLAYSTDETGFRQYTLRVKDLSTGKDGSEAIERVRSLAWAADNRTFLYTVEDPTSKRSWQVLRHKLGEAKDEVVYEEKDERFNVGVGDSRDQRYIFVTSGSHTTSEVRVVPTAEPGATPRLIAPREHDHEYYLDHRDGLFWILTNDKGRNYRVVTAPVAEPGRSSWKEVIAHRDDVMLENIDLFRDFYVLLEREGGLPHLRVTTFAKGETHRIEFPEAAYVAGAGANREFDATLYRFTYQSPISPASTFDYDPVSRKRTLLKQVAVLGGYDPTRYKVDRVHVRTADGVNVPMWLLYRKDVKLDGTAAGLLTAYGSYGSSYPAAFASTRLSLVDRGMVFAVASIRGGGDLGKRWHDDGRMMKKQNSFTDFIAAAEHMMKAGYVAKDRLAIEGGSAGGLLMGAVANMRPDLFRVVSLYVPFVDVINSMYDETIPLTVGEFEEWGNPKIEEHYRYMRAYSPYDNLTAKAYPTMLVKTSYNDSQVMYWEPAKYVARLRELKTDRNPLVFHINMDPAGHGGKSGRYDRLRQQAFDYAFVLWQLGVEQPAALS